jgi:predicted acyltransferase
VPGADPFSMTGNAGYRLDKWVMGENHMYHGEGVAFDPEGILSTLPAIVNVIAGYFAGVFIRERGKTYEGLSLLLLGGCLSIFLALCWNGVLPINKKLWTPSYVLLTIGIDMVLLAFLIYIIDFRQKIKWTSFFRVFGKNPLFIYILSELLIVVLFEIPVHPGENTVEWANREFFQRGFLQGAAGSLLFSLVYMMICWSVGKWMDSRKIYVRV